MGDQHLYPLRCLDADTDEKCGIIILNQPLKPQLFLVKAAWPKAVVKAAVDGGSNELYDTTKEERDSYIPDIITGDLDSADPDVLQYYKEKDVEIMKTLDQAYTDFTKCLQILADRNFNKKLDSIIVTGSFGGRLDQIFANIDTLFTAKKVLPGIPVYLFSQESVACLLEGKHILHTKSPYRNNWCGLIPIGFSCDCVTTSGLKWNLDKQRLCFGELISTSNTWENDEGLVTIETDKPLLWTMGIKLPAIPDDKHV